MAANFSSATTRLLGGRYRLEGELGAGGEGTVFSAVDTWLADRPVVLKRVGPEAAERLRTEFLALKSLRLPALVEAIDLATFDGQLHLVEARVHGRPLAAWPARRELKSLFTVAAHVAHGLAHLHVRGFVHMDPTPQNIMVVGEVPPRGVLIDLGLVRAIGVRGASGTSGFVAPEVLAGEPVSAAADVYSLAATLTACLTDRRATWGKPEVAGVAHADARRLLEQCFSEAPGSRPTAMEMARRCAAIAGVELPELTRPLSHLPLCGRRKELKAFESWLRAGEGIWLVAGAAASGRSSFLAACLDRARLRGATTLAVELGAKTGFADMVRQIVAVAKPGARLFDELAIELADLVADDRLPKGQNRVRTPSERAHLLVLALDLLAQEQPVVVGIDSVGPSSDDMALAVETWRTRRGSGEARFVMVVDGPLRGPGVELAPLSREGVGELLSAAYGEERPRAEAEHLLNLCGGAPAVLERAIASVARSGESVLTLSQDHLVEMQGALLSGRLEPLAFASGPVPEAVVRCLLGGVEERLAALDGMAREGLVWLDNSGPAPMFRVAGRARRRAAEGDNASLGRLATAYQEAGFPLEAAPLWARAGHLATALELLSHLGTALPDDELRAVGEIADAVGVDSLPIEIVECWARRASDAGTLQPLRVAAASLAKRGQEPLACGLQAAGAVKAGQYEQALETLKGVRDGPVVEAVRARALLFSGRAREAQEVSERGWQGATGEARADLLDVLGHAAFQLGEVEQAQRVLEQALSEAEAGDDVRALGRARHALAIVLQRVGDRRRAEQLYRAALDTADTLASTVRKLNLATLLQERGSYVEARELYREALARAVALANVREQVRVGVNLANLEMQLGNLAAAIELAEETLTLAVEARLEEAALMASLVLAEAQLEREETSAAAETLRRAGALLGRVEDKTAAAEFALLAARVAAASGRSDETREHLIRVPSVGTAHHIQGRLAFWRARLGLLLSLDSEDRLCQVAQESVDAVRGAGDQELLWQALTVQAWAQERLSDPRAVATAGEARRTLDAFLSGMPEALQLSYLAPVSRRDLARRVRRDKNLSIVRPVFGGATAYRRLLAINRRLAREHEVQPLLELIVDAATELLGAERGYLILREGEEVRVGVARNFDRRSLEDGRQRISRSIAAEVLQRGEPLLTTNAQQDERFAGIESVASLKVRSVICVPLRGTARDEDPVIGALYLDHRFQERAFTEEDVEVCSSFADQAAIALDNARLLGQTREQERRLAAQNERLERFNAQLQEEAAAYAEEAEAALRRLREEGPTLGVGRGFERIVGRSDKLREALRLVERFAETDVPVVIFGESGTGKELLARAVHDRSVRRDKPFVSINCAAIPETLIESELFGYTKGAFTGAVRDRAGLFAAAEGGTLLLDEIGDMPVSMQVKLLRVLQEKEYRPVGSTVDRRCDVRMVSASHRDLNALVAEGRFREDLLYRLRVVEVRVPALRERREDIPILVDHFCRKVAGQSAEERFSRDAMARLLGYDWPGNVRELENEVRRAIALAEGLVRVEDLSERFESQRAQGTATLADVSRGSLREILDGFERQVLLATLKRTEWNVRKAAKELGLSRAALYTRLTRYGISREAKAD